MNENLDLFSAEPQDSKGQAAIKTGAVETGVPASVLAKVAQLRTQLNQWAHEYYVQDAPSVPDGEYDKVFQQLL